MQNLLQKQKESLSSKIWSQLNLKIISKDFFPHRDQHHSEKRQISAGDFGVLAGNRFATRQRRRWVRQQRYNYCMDSLIYYIRIVFMEFLYMYIYLGTWDFGLGFGTCVLGFSYLAISAAMWTNLDNNPLQNQT